MWCVGPGVGCTSSGPVSPGVPEPTVTRRPEPSVHSGRRGGRGGRRGRHATTGDTTGTPTTAILTSGRRPGPRPRTAGGPLVHQSHPEDRHPRDRWARRDRVDEVLRRLRKPTAQAYQPSQETLVKILGVHGGTRDPFLQTLPWGCQLPFHLRREPRRVPPPRPQGVLEKSTIGTFLTCLRPSRARVDAHPDLRGVGTRTPPKDSLSGCPC